jgi:hypothetical protein
MKTFLLKPMWVPVIQSQEIAVALIISHLIA